MGAEPLAESCKLAFEVARQGVEANPPIEPPASMRSFLYVAQLPRRAITVARGVIDSDPEFRQRVAAQATEAKVGRAGYLWLHRPDGWESSFSALTGEAAISMPPPPAPIGERPAPVAAPVPASPSATPPSPMPDPPVLGDRAETTDGAIPPPPPPPTTPQIDSDATQPVPATPQPPAPASDRAEMPAAPDLSTGRSEIENELASLRGLVDKLADERQNVGASVENLETEAVERRAESSALTTQLDSVSTDLQRARTERDAALTEKEAATERLVTAEKELTDVRAELSAARVQLTRFETEKGDAASDLATAKETAAALEAQVSEFDDERTALRQQMESVVGERDEAWSAMAELRTERDDLADRVRVAEQARIDLEAELGQVSTNWQDLQVELQNLSNQRQAVEDELAELREIRQTSDTERNAIFTDLASTLGRVEAERDLLAGKLDAAQARLQGTRAALDTATASLQGEFDDVDTAFGETTKASANLDDAVKDASRRLAEIEAEVAAGSPAPASGALGETDLPDSTMPDISIEESTPAPTDGVDVDPADLDDAFAASSEGPISAEPEQEPDRAVGSAEIDGSDIASSDSVIFGEPAVIDAPTADDPAGSPTVDAAVPAPDATDPLATADPVPSEPVLPEPVLADPLVSVDEPSAEEPPADAAGETSAEPSLDAVMESHGLGASEATAPVVEPPVEASSDRTQISSIEGDPVAVARHAVSTPDVVILLDGDPIAEMGWPTLSVVERREALVGYLGNLAAETGAASDVVFEGRIGNESQLPVSRAVRVRLTHSNVDAASALSEVIGEYPLSWPVVVVSDDPRLAALARSAGASLLDNGQLLDLFLASS